MSLVASGLRVTRGLFALDVSFETPLQGVTAVFGPSGAGKSMLLGAIAGLNRIEAGKLSLGDAVLEEGEVRVPAHLRDVGMVFQDARLFPHLSVAGNLRYAAKRSPKPADVEAIAQRLEIAPLMERAVRNLSGGERSRVALARALVSAPRLLLLDEPFAALDGRRRRAFLAMLREIADEQRLPMLVVTHLIEDAAELADHVVAMKDGRVVAEGEATRAMRDPRFLSLLDQRDIGVRLHPAALAGGQRPAGRGVWVRADTVMLASQEPRGLSARNVWPGRVIDIVEEADGSMLVSLDSQAGYILSRITNEAVAELAIGEGSPAWAVMKAHAL